jgi:uncharacterized protein (DUF433 family)
MLRQRIHVERITEDPQVMTGKPVVTGTSIPVEQVLAHLAEKPDLKALFGTYPRLTTEDVQACFAFAFRKLASERRLWWVEATRRFGRWSHLIKHSAPTRIPMRSLKSSSTKTGSTSYPYEEGRELLEQQAWKYLNMSGEDFRRQYRAGLLDREQSEVIRVSFLLSYMEYPESGHHEHSG